MAEVSGSRTRGFASMDKERQRAIASKGGKAAHEKGTAHEFDSREAALAAKRGHERGTAHEFTSAEARIAGRKGGYARKMRGNSAEVAVEGSANGGGDGAGTQERAPQRGVEGSAAEPMMAASGDEPEHDERSTLMTHNGHMATGA